LLLFICVFFVMKCPEQFRKGFMFGQIKTLITKESIIGM